MTRYFKEYFEMIVPSSENNIEAIKSQKQEYLEFHRQMCEKMYNITKAKNADYTGGSDSPFSNFEQTDGVASPEQGFYIRMNDKMKRIASYISSGKLHVKDESVEDTLLDLANYSILFMGYLKSKKEK